MAARTSHVSLGIVVGATPGVVVWVIGAILGGDALLSFGRMRSGGRVLVPRDENRPSHPPRGRADRCFRRCANGRRGRQADRRALSPPDRASR